MARRKVSLATPDSLKQAVYGSEVRKVRATDVEPNREVLPSSSPPTASGNGGVRVFGAAPPEAPKPLAPPVLDDDSRTTVDVDEIIRRIAAEPAPAEFQDDTDRMSHLEVLIRRFFETALTNAIGAQRAREYLLDRLAGKAGRATPPSAPNTELEDQLDRTAIDLINTLTPHNPTEKT